MSRVRWSDNDTYFGPFTYSKGSGRDLGLVIKSRDDDDMTAHGRFHLLGHTLLWPLPGWMVRPYREKVTAKSWDKATVERMGRDWYWNVDKRAFGFTFHEGVLHLYYGRQANDSRHDKSRCIFLPWREWRHVRHSFYDLSGNLFTHVPENDWDARQSLEEACPTLSFTFADFDGEVIIAKTKIEEREWLAGSGHFKWLSWFRRPKVDRSLDLRFSAEVGKRKGSWKGGTIGHSITMLPGELHKDAFRRYCENEGLTFLRTATPETCATCGGRGIVHWHPSWDNGHQPCPQCGEHIAAPADD